MAMSRLSAPRHWFVTCARGLEGLLLTELQQLGLCQLRETVGGCHFEAGLEEAYRVCLWSRLASRVLLPVGQGAAIDREAIYAAVRSIEWVRWMQPDSRFVVDVVGTNSELRNTQFTAQVAKDAVVDYWRERTEQRPNVDRQHPQLRLNLHLSGAALSIALDFAGSSLHRRGYRLAGGEAPLKETLAAALLLRAGWPQVAAQQGSLIDPMCGSGTLLIEGALLATDRAPGLLRKDWGFAHWPDHDPDLWSRLCVEAEQRATQGAQTCALEIRGYDADPRAVQAASENIAAAGLDRIVRVSCKSLATLVAPTHRKLNRGLLICNPPYGERLGTTDSLRLLYAELGAAALREFPDWSLAIFTSEPELARATRLRSRKQYRFLNGAIPAQLYLFDLAQQRRDSAASAVTVPEAQTSSSVASEPNDSMFGNRVRKNLKRLRPWLKQAPTDCYRIYDADMPEYALAVDRYGDWLHVAEYAAPASVSAEAARERLEHALSVLPAITGVPASQMVCKRRERQRGKQQYRRLDEQAHFFTVHEGRARFQVNLHDYLDTGLFLDHRPLRLRLAERCRGKHFLNLFCYTGTASIQAALGGAHTTTSVDLSPTYLAWVRRNLALNGLGEASHRTLQADCLSWLRDNTQQFDTIFLDPPSFSNSKRTNEDFDVQRDHPLLLEHCMRALRPDGELYFSNNLRRFKLAPEIADRWTVEDITDETIDADFTRSRPHRCWRLTHRHRA